MAILKDMTTKGRYHVCKFARAISVVRSGRLSFRKESVSMFLAVGIIIASLPMLSTNPVNGLLAQSISDTQVKAAFLYNFAKFVEWPADAFPDSGAPIVIGVVGTDPFGGTLDKTTSGKTANGRPVEVRRFKLGQDLRGCHILFVGVSDRKQMAAVMLNLNQASVLTVGDMDTFNQEGGIIQFLLEGDKVRFEINTRAATRAQLKISSKLLSLAKSVKN